MMHYKLYLVCQIREHMISTDTGPEQLREAAWAQEKWDDEKLAMDEVCSLPNIAIRVAAAVQTVVLFLRPPCLTPYRLWRVGQRKGEWPSTRLAGLFCTV